MKSHLVKILSTIFMVLLIAQGRLFAQKEANHWIFDINIYLDFSSGTPVATVPPSGPCGTWGAPTCYFFLCQSGCSSISNENGDLVLYADNNVIYNSDFDTIQNGLINSNLFSRQCIIIPRPQRPNRYYVITTPWYMVSNGVRYTEVDIFANGGLGSAISVNTILLPNACQKVTAVYHKNQIDIWLLVHQYHSNAFYAYLVTKNGINLSPVISNVGTSHTENPSTNWCYSDLAGNGEMKFSTDGDKVACAIKGLDIVEVFDFDNATGVLSNPVSLVCGEIESVEFSPDGTLLYTGSFPNPGIYGGCNLILEGNSSKIYQYDLISEDSAAIVNSKTAISIQAIGWKKYLQLGPDMKIYSVSEFEEHLGVITSPNSTGILCDFDSIGFTFPTNYQINDRNSLPNFLRSSLDRNILFEDVCMGDTTLIFTLTNTNFDSIMWSFNDFQLGNQSIWNQDSVYFPFTRPGSYTIYLYRYRDGHQDITSKTLNILPQVNISLSDTTVCQGSEYIFDLNIPYCEFGWINSVSPDTFQTDSFIIQQNTMFWPVLLNHSDYCGSMDNIMISVYADSLNLGNDISGMCINNPITLDAALSNATAYIWSDNSTLDQLVA
ncbi:MAG: hypothetical protein K9I34_04570, partial [Bacteroidales bacterium]|nr:hypothetical protein [Bacteroidales bacterium]